MRIPSDMNVSLDLPFQIHYIDRNRNFPKISHRRDIDAISKFDVFEENNIMIEFSCMIIYRLIIVVY